ncbi:MAG: branched-chain amino acid transporter permease [Polaromonas sp.]|nr:branched-chain amino acid transporter permease [Polaromonas sp.]
MMLTELRDRIAFVADPRVVLVFVLALGIGSEFASGSTVQLWSFVLINVLIAQSINLLTGVAGQISLGHAAFLGIGAYTSALLMKTWGVPLPVALVAATLLSAAAGWLLSFAAGRVREFYLAMMTLGFGMIFYELVREWTAVTGGVAGLSGVPAPSLKTLSLNGYAMGPVAYFQFMLAVTAVVMWQLRNFQTSTYGRAFFAIHASEVAAGSIGVARVGTKREAYTISAALTGLAGGFYAHLVGYLGPESFGLHRSVEALVMAVVGGLGSLSGPVLGAIVFTYLPEKLQFFADWQFMVYGLLLMVSFVLLPKGLAGLLLPRSRYIKASAQTGAQKLADKNSGIRSPAAPVTSETSGAALLVAKDIGLSFLGLRALDGVTLEIRPGQIIGLVGPNGSGKSTLVNVISGIYRPGAGTVTFDGKPISGLFDHEVARLGVLRTFQDPRLVPAFTVRENVLLGMHRLYRQGRVAAALNLPSAHREEAEMLERVNEALALAGLTALADMPVKDLPYGDQRMTELSRVLVADPRVVLLDEPAAGLSEGELVRLADVIRVLKGRGVSVVLIEHHMDFLDDLVDDVVVLDAGKMIYQGGMEGMYRNPAVIAAYLGREGRPEVTHA